MAGYYGITAVRVLVRPSIHPPVICPSVYLYFRFRMITWVNINGFSSKLVCALILWRSGLGLLMGKFRQFLTELSARNTSVFSFPGDNWSKCQWIFTKLEVCIDIVEVWFGIADGQILSIFDYVLLSYLPAVHLYFTFRTIILVNSNGFSPNLVCALILWRSALGLLIGKFRQFFTAAHGMIMAGYYCFTFYYWI